MFFKIWFWFFLEQNNPTGKLCLIDKSLSSCKTELDGDSFDSKTKETFDKIFSVTLIFVQHGGTHTV